MKSSMAMDGSLGASLSAAGCIVERRERPMGPGLDSRVSSARTCSRTS